MGPFFIVLFSLCGVLQAQEAKPLISLDDCCKDGKQRGQESQDCTSLPLISESTTCRIAQEQCCAAVLEDNTCTNGINMAKDQGSCHVLLSGSTCETKTAKMCCECCLLGRAVQEQDLSCDLSLPVGYQCGLVSRRCCVESSSYSDAKYTQDKSSHGAIQSAGDQCKAANCAHICVGNGTCVCFKGHKFKADGKTCEDINECLLGSHHCRAGERCINTMGSYRCQREVSCGTGYELTENNNCEDIDECETGTHNCAPELQCQNTIGSFRCRPKVQCGAGFIQDALGSCIDINECLSVTGPCQPGQMCFNTVGSYTCQKTTVYCGRGYHLNAEGTRCTDINECAGLDNTCDGHGCINLIGSYRCKCRSGYVFNSVNKLCEDINECRNYPGRLCAHKCENVLGSYQCSCTTGFKLANDGRNCDDLNECETNPCSQECANVYGSYQCYCRRGYQLSDVDGITCEDIDECALPTGGHICSYRCHNSMGSFHCTCPVTGYRVAPNGRSCQDIDECATGTHTCTESESCFNIQGGFKCLTFDCPANYIRSEETRCERLPCNQTSECVALPVRITYYHLTFPTKIPIPTDIFRMGPSNSVIGDDIEVAIVDGNQGGYFAAKRLDHGGVLVVQKLIVVPQDFEISLEMKLRRFGHLSVYLFKIRLFVTPDELSNAIIE
ncbi:fibulin-1-like isoform X2 [Xyrauchen texanus]|uniref:fibulin-1-like isoform X2 n=1 Tax=Xyrauchen texanus TaxID=154827 RepID=UPI0022423623|nr:fibulin-1-like isoform X2 [Xyrauchen texanus]